VKFCEGANIEPDMVRLSDWEASQSRLRRILEAIRMGVSEISVAGTLQGPFVRLS
jgi:hypothetical protein